MRFWLHFGALSINSPQRGKFQTRTGQNIPPAHTYKPNNVCNASTANRSASRSAPRISAEYAQKSIYFFFITSSGFWQAQNTANFLPKRCQFFQAVRSRQGQGALTPVVCQSSLTYSSPTYSDLSPLGAENNDTQILCLLCAVLRYFLNAQVLYHVSRLMSKLEIFHLHLFK